MALDLFGSSVLIYALDPNKVIRSPEPGRSNHIKSSWYGIKSGWYITIHYKTLFGEYKSHIT
jgi:hypothetical protein